MKKALVALALLLAVTTIATTIASASLRGRVRRQNRIHLKMCYTSCPFYRDRCKQIFVKGCHYKRCVKEMFYSCLGNPADAQCARPCSEANPCAGGQQCAAGQCILEEPLDAKCQQLTKLTRPKPPTTEACVQTGAAIGHDCPALVVHAVSERGGELFVELAGALQQAA